MSSIRLYVLASLAERGPMHGHALRLLAEKEHIDEWTDFTVGAVYGVLKRLTADGLIEPVRIEREGSYPERHVYAITEAGEITLTALRQEGLDYIDVRPDGFDLALSTLDPGRHDELEATVRRRIAEFERRRADAVERLRHIEQYLWASERWALAHADAKLEAEVAWHRRLLAALPQIIVDEHARILAKGQKTS
jgi:DNA-binding PadR family transcriptional regulator